MNERLNAFRSFLTRLPVPALLLAYIASAAVLIYAPYCMFTRLKMQINDYGIYVNTLWNTAHGHPFRYLMDESYLSTHLSFTLALLAPIYWIFDYPFTLAVVQWLCGIGGSIWMARLAWKRGTSPLLTTTILLFFLTYASMQSVLLCDFHGVCLYFVLFPWLYNELSKKRLLALIPLALILGIREDAAFLVSPMLLYFAVTQRWRTGYILAALALLYGIFAIQWLFPWINGITIWERRADLMDGDKVVSSLSWDRLANRGVAIFWILLPTIPLLRRRSGLPILLFPLAALLIALPSAHLYLQSLDKQYPAAPFTLITLAIIEVLRKRRDVAPIAQGRYAAYMIACIILAHFGMGHLPIGQRNQTRDLMIPRSPYGLTAIHAAKHLPKTGVLLTTTQLSGICANRRDIVLFDRARNRDDEVEIVFAGWDRLFSKSGSRWIALLESGEFGATYFDYNYAILVKGAPTNRNDEILFAHENLPRTVVFTTTVHHHGDTAYTRTWQGTRHWNGNGKRAPANLSYGTTVALDAGEYTAMFRIKSRKPDHDVIGNWGFLELYSKVDDPPFKQVEVDPATAQNDELSWQKFAFTLTNHTDVEIRVTAGDAELWLDRVIFAPGN